MLLAALLPTALGHHDPRHRHRHRRAGGRAARRSTAIGRCATRPRGRAGCTSGRPGTRRFELSRQIREAVTFAPLNLATDGYPGSLDLIVCRNVLMYFTDAARERTVERLTPRSPPGGRLVLSPLDAPAGGSRSPAPAPAAVREPAPPPAPRCRASTRSSGPARRPTAGASTPRVRCAWRRCASARWTPTRTSCWPPSRRSGATSTPPIWALRRAIYTAPDGAGGALPARRPAAAHRRRRGGPAQPRHRRRAAGGRGAGRAGRRPDRRRGAGGGEGGVMTTSRLDWERARQRLERARLALDEEPLARGGARAPGRARAGARRCRTRQSLATASEDDVVVFSLCGERFAVDAEHVLEALRARRADARAGDARAARRRRQPPRARAGRDGPARAARGGRRARRAS